MNIRYILLISLYSIIIGADFEMIDSYSDNQKYDMEFKSIKKLSSDSTNAKVMWRIARAYFNQAEQHRDTEEKNKLFYIGYNYSKKALALDSSIAKANHYYAVFHGQIGLIEGTKQKIINSYDILKYGKIAIKLDPDYDGTYHLLGRLNFELANLSWLERNFASLIYETPPNGTFEEARDYFKSAIKLSPNDPRHWLWLAKTYLKLDQTSEAYSALSATIKIIPKDEQETMDIEEAQKIIDSFN